MNKAVQQNLQTQQRVDVVRAQPKAPRVIANRLKAMTEEQNRANDLATYIQIVDEALCKLVELLYLPAIDGKFANMDPYTGKILVAAPWGSKGWKKAGFRHWEGVVLSRILQARSKNRNHAALFVYHKDRNSWYTDTGFYPTFDDAMAYLERYPISAGEWRKFSDEYARQRKRSKQIKEEMAAGKGFVKPIV